MCLDAETLEKVKKLAEAQRLQYTTFPSRLLKEDIERLWAYLIRLSKISTITR